MKKEKDNSVRASALQITFISISAILLTHSAAPARNQFEQKQAGVGIALPGAQGHSAVSESSGASKA
jgi:hypothetical protein